jgi:transcriptional regulator with XRE-family HTH domain
MRRKTHPVTTKRKVLGLSGYALAKKVGISATHLHDIESGRIASPSVDLALKLAAALESDVRTLFEAPGAVLVASASGR